MACFTIWDIGGCGCNAYTCPACVTCGTGVLMPCTFYVTDANGTWALPYNATYGWWAPTALLCAASSSNCGACVAGSNSCSGAPTNGQPVYAYIIVCSSLHKMTISRYWYYLTCGANHYYDQCACTVNVSGGQSVSSSGAVTVTCPSLSWSGTLTFISGYLTDPVGGTVSFSP